MNGVQAIYGIKCLGLSHSYFQELGQKNGTLNCVSLLPPAVIHKCYLLSDIKNNSLPTHPPPGTHSIPTFSQPKKSGNV